MSEERLTLELDKNLVKDIFDAAGLPMPDLVTQKEFQAALNIIKSNQKPAVSTKNVVTPKEAKTTLKDDKHIYKKHDREQIPEYSPINDADKRIKSILIVDDLGIIIYQLSLLFRKLDFEVVTSQEINDAIDKYKKKDFGYVILDLFIPTDREGLYLLDEIKKLSLFCKLNSKIIVMSAISKETYKSKVINHGADCFIEKALGWQKKLIEACTD